MSIDATCPTCSNAFQFTDDFAGRLFLCRKCNNTFSIPSADPAANDTSVLPPPMKRLVDRREPGSISRPRKLAGLISTVLGVLLLLGGLCIGANWLLFNSLAQSPQQNAAQNPQTLWLFNTVNNQLGLAFLITTLLAVIYIGCGISIRHGGRGSVVVMTLLTLLALLRGLFTIVSFFFGSGSATLPGSANVGVAFVLIISAVMVLVHGKLLLCLIAVLAERPRSHIIARA